MNLRLFIRSPRRRGRCGQTHGLPFRHLRHLSRINPIQADYSFAQALWIALALFRDLDDGFGNQRGHGGLTVIHLQSRKRKLVSGDDGREVFRAKYRPFLCLFLLQKGMDRHTRKPHAAENERAPQARRSIFYSRRLCDPRLQCRDDFTALTGVPILKGASCQKPGSCIAKQHGHLITSSHQMGIRHSPNGTLWNASWDHSGLILAVRMTFAHFSVSSAMNLAKSAAKPPNAMPPSSASRAFVVGSASAALIPWLSLSKISAGVALGRPTPCHELASYPGTNSLTLGTSGSPSHREVVVTASGRSLSPLM